MNTIDDDGMLACEDRDGCYTLKHKLYVILTNRKSWRARRDTGISRFESAL